MKTKAMVKGTYFRSLSFTAGQYFLALISQTSRLHSKWRSLHKMIG